MGLSTNYAAKNLSCVAGYLRLAMYVSVSRC